MLDNDDIKKDIKKGNIGIVCTVGLFISLFIGSLVI